MSQRNANSRPGFRPPGLPHAIPSLGGAPLACAFGCLFSISFVLSGCSSSNKEGATDPTTHVVNRPVSSDVTNEELVESLDDVIDFTQRRHLSAVDHNAWQIVHGMLAFSHDLQLEADGKVVPALDWILAGGSIKGWTMAPGEKGLEAVLDPGSKVGQGHEDQWLGYLSQCEIDPETPLVIHGMKYKVGDLITQAQWDVHDGMEATWTLMALSTYLPLDAKWKSKDGSEWTLERIVAMEASQDIHVSACGGTHRLYGLCTAVNRYKNSGGQMTGGWLKAQNVINDAVAAAKKFQQPDGGFSTNYLARSGNSPGHRSAVGKQRSHSGVPDAGFERRAVEGTLDDRCGRLFVRVVGRDEGSTARMRRSLSRRPRSEAVSFPPFR